ncbi:MAG: TVP38/TMEM64 family protein [Bosea sp. (in: a-proteobacteria)]
MAGGDSKKMVEAPVPERSRWLKPALILACIAALALVWWSGLGRYLSFDALAEHRAALKAFVSARWLAALALYMVVYVVAVALSVPGALVLTVLGGLLFGPVIGSLAVILAATVGACIVFLLARSAFGEHLTRKAGGRLAGMVEGFRQDEVSYLLFLRLVPVFPFWLVNLAPALAGVRFGNFAWTTLIGIAPGTAAFVVAGAGADSVLAAHGDKLAACRATARACEGFDPSVLVTPQLGLALALLGLVALVPVIWRRLAQRRTMDN